jgi:Tfp pilus assembly protein PilX
MSIYYTNPTYSSESVRRTATRALLSRQSGVALFMVLMVLLVIIALSVSLAIGVFSEHRISRNTADSAIARQGAEAALRDAELDILCQAWNAGTNQFEFRSSIPGPSNPNPSPRSYCTQMPQTCTQIGSAGVDVTCSNGMIAIPMSAGNSMPSSTTDFKNCKTNFGQFTGQPALQIAGLNSQPVTPYYTIEVYQDNTGAKGIKPIFRIRSRGFGRDQNTTVDLESLYRPCDQ